MTEILSPISRAAAFSIKHEIPGYHIQDYCSDVLNLSKKEREKIEVCYNLPNFDRSLILATAEEKGLSIKDYCVVYDEYSVFLMPNKITMKEHQQNNKKNGTPDLFYKITTTPSAKAGTGVLRTYYTSLNNAIIAGDKSLLDETGHYQIKKYFFVNGRPDVKGKDSSDLGTIVWDSRDSFECNVDESYKDLETDEWEAACLWDQTGLSGVEYNFCVDSGINECAIYKMEMNPETDEMETDSNTFEPYEIDFNDPHWEDELRAAMTTAYSHFFLEEERAQSQIQTV